MQEMTVELSSYKNNALNKTNTGHEDVDRLFNLRKSIQSPALGNFLDNLLWDSEIMIAFVKAPASVHHHHNYVGGLLAHSLETAETASQLKYESTEEREITIIAALLHDIGKIKSYTTHISTSNLGKMVSHDHLTLEVCAGALKQLDKDWPDAAIALRHIWTCASAGSRYGFQPSTPLANIVRFADKFSADCYDHKSANWRNPSKDGFTWIEKDRKYFWKPASELIKTERRKICF